MRIIINEIKKIFNITNLIVVGILTILMWVLFISFEIEVFPNGQPTTESFNESIYMLEKYGLEMDEEEFKDYKIRREDKAKEATKYLSINEESVRLGINTYEDYLDAKQNTLDKRGNEKETDIKNLLNKIIFEDNISLFWELSAIDYFIERYEDKEFWMDSEIDYSNKVIEKRHQELTNSDNANSPFNFVIYTNYNELIIWINILSIMIIATMISPIFINDNKNKVNYLQYSSKTGRKIFNKKIISGVISAIILITIQLGIFFTVYKSNNTYQFWDCSINSVFSDTYSWIDITFGKYIILTVILTYILGIAVCIVSMFVSSKVSTYISLIGIQIPILFGFGAFIQSVGINNVTVTYLPKYTVHVLYLVLMIVTALLIYKMIKKEKKIDIK